MEDNLKENEIKWIPLFIGKILPPFLLVTIKQTYGITPLLYYDSLIRSLLKGRQAGPLGQGLLSNRTVHGMLVTLKPLVHSIKQALPQLVD